jgi:predicted nucleic acid-binding protein
VLALRHLSRPARLENAHEGIVVIVLPWQAPARKRLRGALRQWYHVRYHARVARVVLDTNVLVAAVRSRQGASFEVLSRVGTGMFEVAVSVPLVLEYEDALLRHVAATSLTESDIRDLLDYVCSVASHQEVFFLWRPFLRDVADDMIVALAVAAGCEIIVTHNVRDFRGAERFAIRVITPAQFLQELRGPKWVH